MEHSLYIAHKHLAERRAERKLNSMSDAFLNAIERKAERERDLQRHETRKVKRFVPAE